MSLSELPHLQGQTSKGSSPVSSLQFSNGFDISGYGLLSERDYAQEDQDVVPMYPFGENDAEEAVKCLRKSFQVLNPGSHIAKRNPEHGSINFVHCRHSTLLGKHYLQLRLVMEERARIELLRACLNRIKLAATFVKDLEGLVLAEYRILYAITHDCVSEIPLSKLCCLNALCEDLRTQIGHWNCIKQKIHTNRWLQPIVGSLYFQLDHVKRTLYQMRDRAIWWLDRLITVGFEVFAHGNVESVTHEMIWNITRGLEDFNSIVNGLKNSTQTATSRLYLGSLSQQKSTSAILDPCSTNLLTNPGENVRAIPFSRVLNTLANERSKYAALETHRFFTTNEEFLKVLYSGRLTPYSWTDEARTSDRHGSGSADTSDYHTATGSMTSLSAAVLKVGSIRAPDLSNLVSPLVEVARKEHTFAESFLLIVCNSTNLLRKNDSHARRSKTVRLPVSPASAKPPRGHMTENPVLSRSDSLRKSVSWGDSADSSIRSQLVSRYMDMYWGHFGVNLGEMFLEPNWGPQKSLYQCQIGSLLVCNTTVIAVVKHMMEHVCLKGPLTLASLGLGEGPDSTGRSQMSDDHEDIDVFPTGCITPMLTAARKCLHTAAFGAWDTCLCNALSSQLSDKCYPCPLVNGEYSTRTGMMLRDTYQPMLNMLREQVGDTSESTKGSNFTSKSQPDVCQVVALATRLAATSEVAYNWCSTKTHQFLTNMSISNFLLISQTDLRLLVEETQACVNLVQTFCKNMKQKNVPSANEHLKACLNEVIQHLTTLSAQLQGLPGSCMKQFSTRCFSVATDYFKQTMPAVKTWRKKPTTDLPTSHNLYIEHVLETVLEPVLEGVSKLGQTTQLSVISMATASICEALTSIILKEKIKFSYVGAYQLGIDVSYMKTWLKQGIRNEVVQQSVLDLSILKYMTGAVLLLKRQPARRAPSRFREPCASENTVDVSSDYIHGERMDAVSEVDISHVSNAQDWLALRVSGGGRGWRISSCFNSDT